MMDREGRTKSGGAQRTPAESLKAYRSYSGYFGRFRTYENQNPPFVYHSQQGTTNPGGYSEQKRFYQFTGNVLRLGGPPNLNEAGAIAWGAPSSGPGGPPPKQQAGCARGPEARHPSSRA